MDLSPQQMPAAPSRRGLLIIGVVVVLLAVGALGAFVAGRLADRPRFDAVPPVCATVTPLLPMLTTAYTTVESSATNCDLVPAGSSTPELTVRIVLADTTAQAKEEFEGVPGLQEMDDLGDEGYLFHGSVVARVSNMLVGVVARNDPGRSPFELVDFVRALVAAVDR